MVTIRASLEYIRGQDVKKYLTKPKSLPPVRGHYSLDSYSTRLSLSLPSLPPSLPLSLSLSLSLPPSLSPSLPPSLPPSLSPSLSLSLSLSLPLSLPLSLSLSLPLSLSLSLQSRAMSVSSSLSSSRTSFSNSPLFELYNQRQEDNEINHTLSKLTKLKLQADQIEDQPVTDESNELVHL